MISVVIPAYNESKYISACLEAFTTQTYRGPYEIIIVDNASTDDTAAIANAYQSRLPIRVITEPSKGRGPARQAGFMAAQGDIILSIDADAVPPSDWLEVMVQPFTNPQVVGITGTCYITDQSWVSNLVFNLIQPAVTHLHRLTFGSYWVCGSNGGVRKSAFLKTGGFDTDLNSQEDTQFSLALQKQGHIQYIPESKVETSGRRFNSGIIKGLLEYVRSFLERFLLRKKNVHLRDAR